MSELWELYTKDKQRTGLYYVHGSGFPIPQNMYHVSVEVWVKNDRDEILITQRHPCKDFALMWDNPRGDVMAGEEVIQGAVRELFDKTGIVASKEELTYLGETLIDDHFMVSYLYHLKDSGFILHLQPNEAIEARYITSDILDDLEVEIVPHVWRRYIKYRDKLSTL